LRAVRIFRKKATDVRHNFEDLRGATLKGEADPIKLRRKNLEKENKAGEENYKRKRCEPCQWGRGWAFC